MFYNVYRVFKQLRQKFSFWGTDGNTLLLISSQKVNKQNILLSLLSVFSCTWKKSY